MEKNLYTLLLPQVQHEQCSTKYFLTEITFFPLQFSYMKVKKNKSFDQNFFFFNICCREILLIEKKKVIILVFFLLKIDDIGKLK